MSKTTNETEARQGENSGRMPYVLALSVIAVVMAFGGLFGYTAIYTQNQTHNTASNGAAK